MVEAVDENHRLQAQLASARSASANLLATSRPGNAGPTPQGEELPHSANGEDSDANAAPSEDSGTVASLRAELEWLKKNFRSELEDERALAVAAAGEAEGMVATAVSTQAATLRELENRMEAARLELDVNRQALAAAELEVTAMSKINKEQEREQQKLRAALQQKEDTARAAQGAADAARAAEAARAREVEQLRQEQEQERESAWKREQQLVRKQAQQEQQRQAAAAEAVEAMQRAPAEVEEARAEMVAAKVTVELDNPVAASVTTAAKGRVPTVESQLRQVPQSEFERQATQHGMTFESAEAPTSQETGPFSLRRGTRRDFDEMFRERSGGGEAAGSEAALAP